jgi:hypothetical protein
LALKHLGTLETGNLKTNFVDAVTALHDPHQHEITDGFQADEITRDELQADELRTDEFLDNFPLQP